ncbi:hypothetical protein [Gelria sp. Kuro-4]|uniref:hypothetical protein n=1 Tax=Gelria sp. Kuro-4 TaxID=2796927 RepID=UPI001BF17E42|nr:hypothetical protein [Gelria sp. Kuro-4]BCV25982.1 hypothetical protein kuro4_27550 [Gelria sp. Kuro-4]
MPKKNLTWNRQDRGLEELAAEHNDPPDRPAPRESRFQDAGTTEGRAREGARRIKGHR